MKKLISFLALISLSAFFIYSCQKDKTYQAGESNNLRTTVTGIVLDESNAALSGVTVTAYGQTTTTNQYGTFVLKNLNANKDRCVLEFSKTGFFKRSHGFIAAGNTVNYVRIILLSNTSSQNFSSSTGGTVSLTDGSSAEFQPNSFVTSDGNAYTGTVNIAIKHLSPDDANFGFMIPGGDLLGKNLNDEDVALITYGMLGVELTGSSGEPLQLAAGSPATLTFSIAASQLSSAPATIPLWYFDETTSLWKEEGTANKVGNNYVGTVSHFSWWNCDVGANSPIIKGKVVDCNGIPIPNIVVTVNGWATIVTNQNGEWQGQVPAGITFTVQVLMINNSWLTQDSQIEYVSALSNNQVFTVPDLVVPCNTRVIGTIKSCSGEATDGSISVSNGSIFIYQYITNGAFNLMTPENTQMDLYAINSNFNYTQTITTLAYPNNLNVGNLLLCDTLLQYDNSFYIDGGGYNHELILIDTINTGAGRYASSSPFNINIYGFNHIGGQSININIQLNDSLPGPYTCDYFLDNIFNLYLDIDTYSSTPTNASITVSLNEVHYVGERVKGTFTGTIAPFDTILGPAVMISNGRFNVSRTQ
jgi:hypothetical protein